MSEQRRSQIEQRTQTPFQARDPGSVGFLPRLDSSMVCGDYMGSGETCLMHAYRAATLTELHESLCTKLVEATGDQLDVVSSVDVQLHDTISQADSMAWDFDMKNMWLTKPRWTMMARQYIDGERLQAWIDMCTAKLGLRDRGIAHMRTKDVKARGGAATGHTNKETRRWGSCMLGLSYKAVPKPTIVLYSRTSYLGYLAALDLTVAWMCARYLAAELECDVSDFSFVWMNEALQYHNFKSMAFLLNHPDPERQQRYRTLLLAPKLGPKAQSVIDSAPALRLTRKWMEKLLQADEAGDSLGDMTYNTYRRIRRRYHTEVLGYERAQEFEGWSYWKRTGPHGEQVGDQKEFFKAYLPLPSVRATTLDFSCIGMPLGRRYGSEFVGGGEEEDDDE